MDVLEKAFLPLLNMVNRQIRAKTPARDICAELDGRVLAVRVSNSALVAFMTVSGLEISLTSRCEKDPDVVVSGSVLSLLRLAASGEGLIRDGSVDFRGDSEIAERFQRLLAYGRPDLEEELSNVVGDVAAHSIGEFARGVSQWGRAAGSTMRQNVTEYLQEESRALPSRYEVEKFREQVDELRDDVARLASKLRNLEERVDAD